MTAKVKKTVQGRIISFEGLRRSQNGNDYLEFVISGDGGVFQCICFKLIAEQANKLLELGVEVTVGGEFDGSKILVGFFQLPQKKAVADHTKEIYDLYGGKEKYEKFQQYQRDILDAEGKVIIIEDGEKFIELKSECIKVGDTYKRKVTYLMDIIGGRELTNRIRAKGFSISTKHKFREKWLSWLDEQIAEARF